MPQIQGPDQAQWGRMMGPGAPVWLPFVVAAGAGAALWAYANWTRWAMAPWAGAPALGGQGDGHPVRDASPAAAPEPEAPRPVSAAAPSEEPPLADNDDGSDALDAAYAANLGPVPLPKEAPRRAGRAAPKKAAAKSAPAKAATAKGPAAKSAASNGRAAPARAAPAGRGATKSPPARSAASRTSSSRRAPAKRPGKPKGRGR